MSSHSDEARLYFSDLAREPDMGEIVELFVQELPIRVAALREAASNNNWEDVGRLAHQLKGASGSHGFPELASAAADAERSARFGGRESDITAALDRLAIICALARAGNPPQSLVL
jgi:histidine phosphotransfer protein HptB